MRSHTEILSAIRADFVANLALQEAYEIDAEKTFEEQFSQISVESALTYIVASAIYLHELIVNDKATELESKIASEYPFTKNWYKVQFLAFQLGDNLVFDEIEQKFQYPAIDESKQKVKFVAIREREVEGVSKLHVYVTTSDKAALTVGELDAFKAYAKQIGAAGTHFQFTSLAPDQLEINLVVTYNPQLLGNSGESLADGINTVNNAIAAYLDGIRYSGMFNRTKCIDSVQNATGILDAVLGGMKMNGDTVNTQSFESPSGFFNAQTINVTYTAGNADDY